MWLNLPWYLLLLKTGGESLASKTLKMIVAWDVLPWPSLTSTVAMWSGRQESSELTSNDWLCYSFTHFRRVPCPGESCLWPWSLLRPGPTEDFSQSLRHQRDACTPLGPARPRQSLQQKSENFIRSIIVWLSIKQWINSNNSIAEHNCKPAP